MIILEPEYVSRCRYSATGYRTEKLGFYSQQEQKTFHFCTASKPALVSCHPPYPNVTGEFLPRIKWPLPESDHTPLIMSNSEMNENVPPRCK
jgi:hypothetical protein